MLAWIGLLALLLHSELASAQAPLPADPTCVGVSNGAWFFTSTGCQDVISQSACFSLMNVTSVASTAMGRQGRCNVNATAQPPASPNATDLASTCPATCGYCCLTPAYNCQNPVPRSLDCTQVGNQCTNQVLTTQIAQDCPNVCGFCQSGTCVDSTSYCQTDPTICYTYANNFNANYSCPKTCKTCTTKVTTTTTVASIASASCSGSDNAACGSWNSNGFCKSSSYTTSQKSAYCPQTCCATVTGG